MVFSVDAVETRYGVEDDFVGVSPRPARAVAEFDAARCNGRAVYQLVFPTGRTTPWIPLANSLDMENDCA